MPLAAILPIFGNHAFRAGNLFPRRQKPLTIKERPTVELAGGKFDVVGVQLDAQFDDFIDLIDIMPVQDEIQHHRVIARFNRFGHRQLLLEGFYSPPAQR